MTIIDGYDITAGNYALRPPAGHPCLYATGTPDIRATPAMLRANPGAVLINQDPGIAPLLVQDAYDVEAGAIPVPLAGPAIMSAWDCWHKRDRAGQRTPAVYMSRSNVTPVVNALIAAGVKTAGLWVADWNLTRAEAAAEVERASGPYPVIGVQYRNAGAYDLSVFSASWIASAMTALPAPPAPELVPPWFGVFTGMRAGTEAGRRTLFTMPLVSHDNGKTFLPDGPGQAL